jgi:hypothetical protein
MPQAGLLALRPGLLLGHPLGDLLDTFEREGGRGLNEGIATFVSYTGLTKNDR